MKILIYHSYGMGDMIMFTPVLEELKKYYPNSEIDFMITDNEKLSAKPIEHFKNIGRIYFLKLRKHRINYIIEGIKIRKKYDLIIMTNGSTTLSSEIFSLFAKAKKCSIELRPKRKSIIRYLSKIKIFNKYYTYVIENFNEDRHRVLANLNLLEKTLNIVIRNKELIKTKYYLEEINYKNANNFLTKNKLQNEIILGIHPGSNVLDKKRRWSKENYLKVIKEISKKINIIIFLGPDEKELSDYFKNNLKEYNIIFCKEKNLSDVAAIISKCTYFFNSDSGLGHIAGCFNLKRTFTIFGPANPNMTRVYSQTNMLIYKKVNNKKYYEEIDESGKLKCLSDITPEEVIEKIIKV